MVELVGMLQRRIIQKSIIMPYLAATLGGTNGKINVTQGKGSRKLVKDQNTQKFTSFLCNI